MNANNTASRKIKAHKQYSEADYANLSDNRYTDAQIIQIWDREQENAKTINPLFEKLALKYLDHTLKVRKTDRLDFFEISVWSGKRVIEAAYQAGRKATKTALERRQKWPEKH
ncbi:MAG: hypothetical protein PHV82_04745 [Victivallaceae bacterium]|nr:hypothetical protein [Victivallaceae bacterium]